MGAGRSWRGPTGPEPRQGVLRTDAGCTSKLRLLQFEMTLPDDCGCSSTLPEHLAWFRSRLRARLCHQLWRHDRWGLRPYTTQVMEAWQCDIHGVTAKCPFKYMNCDHAGSLIDTSSPTLWDWVQPPEPVGPQASTTERSEQCQPEKKQSVNSKESAT